MLFDVKELYKQTFGSSNFHVPAKGSDKTKSSTILLGGIPQNPNPAGTIQYNSKQISLNKQGLYGQEIWHPIALWRSSEKVLEIDNCTMRVNVVKTIVRTAVSERKGTVKEQFSIDDYKFTIKGFLIGKNRKFPEEDIIKLKEIFESNDPISLHGGYPELFLDDSCRIVIDTLDFPDVQGKAHWIRPFSFTCESDFITDLIIQ
ncbi:DUF6046 domain-containing protein [Flavobacterium kingsejongi]|uniref:DUF6046 domain-containing protein n=1 Tax=Flavobacterium kingsejongi TaxID=1678728 RepID=A0A2S1LM74_9FLAO|nr:DUF6046 domain-containing protein [Flavobacterium kingsejongi]AWG24824.1 hypothetical protein FK004_06065 [Flavobacterium kingsejongi]